MLAEEAVDLFYHARHIGAKLEIYYKATALNFSIQDGIDSGQSVNVRFAYNTIDSILRKLINYLSIK